jgi:hypothetical protein
VGGIPSLRFARVIAIISIYVEDMKTCLVEG